MTFNETLYFSQVAKTMALWTICGFWAGADYMQLELQHVGKFSTRFLFAPVSSDTSYTYVDKAKSWPQKKNAEIS